MSYKLREIVLLIILIIITVVAMILTNTKEHWFYINSTEATYKGYIQSKEYLYPIVEIDGVEHIAVAHQRVRDSSYIGQTVTIKYKNDYRDFLVIWD